MLKVVTPSAMANLEARAFQKGASANNFMENAGKSLALFIREWMKNQSINQIYLLVGKGNNGGDALVTGRYLLNENFPIYAIQHHSKEECSILCQQNRSLFEASGGKIVKEMISFLPHSLIIDGLFGTGFKGTLDEKDEELIRQANQSQLPIFAVDIPSGLNGETGIVETVAIQATYTLFLELPKTGFFLNQGWNFVGKLEKISFGLPLELTQSVETSFLLATASTIHSLLPSMKRSRQKYQAGFVVGLAGSPGMPGAALLATLAAFRGGCGIVRLLYPQGMENELAASFYELIKVPYHDEKTDDILEWIQKSGATFIGPGIGRSTSVAQLLESIVPKMTKPCVIDADALNLFAKKPFKLPQQTIFTPHTGEMQTLLHSSNPITLSAELLLKCQQYAIDNQVTLILKGAPTFIFHPTQPIIVNPTGDPGMATAGSGDVLTGFLAALLSQKLPPYEAAITGVFLHGLAGELAAIKRQTSVGLMASDLIEHLNEAFVKVQSS